MRTVTLKGSVYLTEAIVDNIIKESTSETEIVHKLYERVIPQLTDVNLEKVDSFPMINSTTNQMIFEKIFEFNKENKPDHMSGGVWFNNGFSSSHDKILVNWEVLIDGVKLLYKE